MYFDNVSALFQRLNRLGEARRPCFFLINYELTEGYLSLVGEKAPDFWATIQGRSNVALPAPEDFPAPVAQNLTIHPESLETYARRFEIIQAGLHHGNSFLANLTIRTPIDGPLSLQSIFLHSPALYKVCLPHQFVCFSPERFIAINAQGRIAAHPMKGTIDATLPNAAETILSDPKEQAEHATIVDLLRNDLGSVATDIEVRRYRYIDRIATAQGAILQVSSEVVGQLPSTWPSQLGDMLSALLPAGSICGAPKASTVKLIAEAEQISRGYYTGICGYFDGQMLDCGVMIRFIELKDGQYYFRSGGGITVNSDCRKEYEEVIQKVYLPR